MHRGPKPATGHLPVMDREDPLTLHVGGFGLPLLENGEYGFGFEPFHRPQVPFEILAFATPVTNVIRHI
jgi:hypothetical protein